MRHIGLWLIASLVLCCWGLPARAQDVLFEDYFETGESFSWTRSTGDRRIPLMNGGSLFVRQGSAEPGTTFDVTPVPIPELPAGFVGRGTAYEIDIDPPLLFPATLRLPIPAKRDQDRLAAFGALADGNDELYRAVVTVGAMEALIKPETTGTWLIVDLPVGLAMIESVTVDPPSVGVGDPVGVVVEWRKEVTNLRADYGDGEKQIVFPESDDRSWGLLHQYWAPRRYVGAVEIGIPPPFETVTPLEYFDVRVFADPRGVWHSSFGDIAFERRGGSLTGTYDPAQHGLITGFLSGDTLEGFWVENASARPCAFDMLDSEGELSDRWGRIKFVFSADSTEFCGTWGYCDETPTRGWDGWRGPFSTPPICGRTTASR